VNAIWVQPQSGRPGMRPGAGGGRPGSNGGPRPGVLVVDDDPSILEMVAEILRAEGYAVRTAENGREALDRIEQDHPKLVLLDMRMPVLDGWQFMRELRARSIPVPVVVMTAAENSARWASEVGADGHLAKPFLLEDLLQAVERFGGGPQRPH
jgi:two-component system chemotaxis response regulator CheY